MEIGRVDGFVTITQAGQRRITVILDVGREMETVRDEPVPDSLAIGDAAQLAEQFVREAIANELA